MADTKMFWGRSDKSKMFDTDVFNQRYQLVKYAIDNGFDYQQFSDYCYDNGHNFSVITTVMNIFGLIQLDASDKLESNSFLNNNIADGNFLKLYLEYYLSYWQHTVGEVTVKPYLLVLKVLKLLKEKGESPYLSEYEFTETFKDFKSYDDINDALIDDIIAKRRAPQNNQYGNLGYSTKAYLQYSNLLSFDKTGKNTGFFVGLVDNTTVDKKIESLLSHVISDDIFVPESGSVKKKNTEWGKFLNNKRRFNRWFITMSIHDFKEYCSQEGLEFHDDLIRRFILSLETKPFLLLTGISGSGKTKIAELYGEYLAKNSLGKHHILPVGSNWNDNKKLLGFQNPLQSDPNLAYQKTEFVSFVQEANSNEDKKYIIILDEMNLSYTEKYFADFLSALESRTHEISLPNGEKIKWTENLKIIGTINEDETTHTISPKVLDRANVIEMNGLNPKEYISSQIEQNSPLYKELESDISIDAYTDLLNEIYESLDGNFAFRVVNEISLYINQNKRYDPSKELHILLDEQIYQKILPKIHGSKLDLPKKLKKLQEVLERTENPYTLTNNKIAKMLSHVSTHGYASFITG